MVRMGGDEFAIFMPRPSAAEVLNGLADQLLAAFRKPFDVDGNEVGARLSIGGALAPQAGADRATLLQSVDEALYQAKIRARPFRQPRPLRHCPSGSVSASQS